MKACFFFLSGYHHSPLNLFDCNALTYLKLLECRAQSNDKSSRTLNLGTPHHLSFIHIDTFTFTLALSIIGYLSINHCIHFLLLTLCLRISLSRDLSLVYTLRHAHHIKDAHKHHTHTHRE